MTAKLIDDCFLHDGQRMRHDQAIALLSSRVSCVVPTELLPLAQATGRILASEVKAGIPVPAHTNSAVDGYAFPFADYDPVAGARLPVFGRATAGHAITSGVPAGMGVRIFTGAVVPDCCDTVVMQEDVRAEESHSGPVVLIPPGLKKGANVRQAGEDVSAGDVLCRSGHRLRPQDIAALASVGIGEVACRKRLRVAVVSTGDEVIRPGGRALHLGEVYDANVPLLLGLLSGANVETTDLGILPDRPADLRKALAKAADEFDVILTSGGASRGEEDHLAATLETLGKRHMWQLAVKPGRPMMFGQIGDCIVVGLPGNPVAVLVCCLMYVWPMLARLGGADWPEPRHLPLRAAFSFTGRKPGRREFWRGILVDRNGDLLVDKYRRDGSGLISGLRAADGLIDVHEDCGDVSEGDLVRFIPFSEFGIVGHP